MLGQCNKWNGPVFGLMSKRFQRQVVKFVRFVESSLLSAMFSTHLQLDRL